MPAGPLVVSSLLFAASVAWAVRLAFASSPLAGSSAILVGGGAMIVATIAVAGILLARARWARPVAGGLLIALLAIAAGLPGDAGTFAVVGLCVLALGGIAGPWLTGWLRRLPAALGPPPRITAMLLGLAALPVAAGLAAPRAANPAHWLLAATGLLLGWAYARAHRIALWGLRFVLPAAGIAAAVWSPPGGAAALLAIVAVLTGVAWTRQAALLTAPLAPMHVPSYRIPPELAPADVLHAAGLDEHGRPRSSP